MTINFFDAPTRAPELSNDPSAKNIFLAGPILGADIWQEHAKRLIQSIADSQFGPGAFPTINVWNPRRPEFLELKDFEDSTFYEQVDWEHDHLKCSSNNGVILFWLCNRTVITDRNYALTTLFELGEAIGQLDKYCPGKKAIIGIEQGFTNKKYLQYTINKKTFGCNAGVVDTLEAAVYAALMHLHFEWSKTNG